ncbi:MAG: hypothetical protein QXU52_00460 [Fervidicoccaceae archaeon]
MVSRVALIGFGGVGRRALLELERRFRGRVEVAAVSSSRGAVMVQSEGDLRSLLELSERGLRLDAHPSFAPGVSALDAVEEANVDLALVALPPSYETGEPNLSIYRGLVELGVSIVTADKTGLALDYWGLLREAERRGLFVGYRATVAAGTPVLDAVRGLRGREVSRVLGVLNATTNYVLTLIESGLSYGDAVSRAAQEGLTEPDPAIDLEGLDPAAKIAIVGCELGLRMTMREVRRTPLSSVDEDEVRAALRRGARVKYVASIDVEGERAEVTPLELPAADPMSRLSGARNAVAIDVEGEIIYLEGPAGPAWRTAKVMMTDVLDYLRALEQGQAT